MKRRTWTVAEEGFRVLGVWGFGLEGLGFQGFRVRGLKVSSEHRVVLGHWDLEFRAERFGVRV